MKVIQLWKRLLVVAMVAVLLTASSSTAQADTILSGSTFYSYGFEDVTPGNHPASSTGGVAWTGLIQSSRTRVRVDPADAGNQVLQSNPIGSSSNTGQAAVFSNAVPTAGTIDFRLYLDDLSAGNTASVFRVMKDANSIVVNNANTLFGVLAESGGDLRFTVAGSSSDMRPVVLDEWIDVSIDYALDNSANNLKVTLNSPSIANESFFYTADLTGETTNGFFIFNFGSASGDNVFSIDDINWTSPVPEPSSLVLAGFALLAMGVRRKS